MSIVILNLLPMGRVAAQLTSNRIGYWIVAATSVTLLVYMISPGRDIFYGNPAKLEDSLKTRYDTWPVFSSEAQHSTKWYRENCFTKNFTGSVEAIFVVEIPHWSKSTVQECQDTYDQLDLLYEIHIRHSGQLTFPEEFAKRVHDWLGGDAELLKKVHHQDLIHVYHPLTSEHVVYNPVRAKRPMPEQKINLFEWVDKQSTESAKNCDLCNALHNTAMDDLGRKETEHTIRMSNTFKLDAWHTMVVTRQQHHPLNFNLETFIAFFDDAWNIVQEVSAVDKEYIYSNLVWDSLYQSGVSQLHPHLHVIMSNDHYHGFMELLRTSGQRYFNAVGRNYFTTLLEIHEALGLTIHYGNSVAFPTLAGKTDMEVMFLSEAPGEDFYRLIFYTVQAYHDSFTQLCKGFAAVYPAPGDSEAAGLGRIPVVARLISRGDCPSPRVDYTSCEIFQVTYRNHDPWKVAEAIREAVKKYDKP